MKRSGLMAAMAMLAMGGALGAAAHPIELVEAPEPARKKRVSTAAYSEPPRSKRMPHIGAKERARHAGKPDGPMHRTPHEHREFCRDLSRISFAHNTGRMPA